jgi:hypothetical protein
MMGKIKNSIGYLIVLSICGILMLKFQTTENDYAVYDRAGQEYRSGNNPWKYTGDVNNTYLYGPLTTIFISLYTLLPIKIGVTLLRLTTLTLICILAWQVKELSSLKKIGILGLTLSLFPVRANLEYGNFTIVLCALLLLYKPYPLVIDRSIYRNLIFGFLSAISFDYKPHLFFPVAFLALVSNRSTRFAFLGAFAFGAIASSARIENNALSLWVRSILNRAMKSSSDKTDQMNFHAILNQLGIHLEYFPFLFLVLAGIIALMYLKPKFIRGSILLVGLILFPFIHSSDVGILLLLLLVARFRKMDTCMGKLSIGLLAVWSDSPTGALLACVSIILFYLIQNSAKNRSTDLVLLILPNILFIFITSFSFVDTGVSRHVFNFFGIAFTLYLQERDGLMVMRFREFFFSQAPIYVRSTGGFGNRLFAISFAHDLQSKSGRKVKIDIDGASPFLQKAIDDCHHLEKDRYGIGRKLLLLSLLLKKIGFHRRNQLFYVYDDSYDYVEIQKMHNSIYVSGFYQNAKYVIGSDSDWILELENALSVKSLPLSQDVEVANCLVLHIRRGDLLATGEDRGVLDLAYFRAHLSVFQGQSIVVTDADTNDLAEIQSQFPNSVVIGQEVSVELAYALMVQAHELVPSNSTLSWFASLHRYKRGKTPGKMPYPFFKFGPPSPGVLGVEYLGSNPALFKRN